MLLTYKTLLTPRLGAPIARCALDLAKRGSTGKQGRIGRGKGQEARGFDLSCHRVVLQPPVELGAGFVRGHEVRGERLELEQLLRLVVVLAA